jgi:hypothetical protein
MENQITAVSRMALITGILATQLIWVFVLVPKLFVFCLNTVLK